MTQSPFKFRRFTHEYISCQTWSCYLKWYRLSEIINLKLDYTDCKTTLIAHSHGTYRFMGRDAKWDFINLTCKRRKACSLSSLIVHNVFNFEHFMPSLYSVALQNSFRSMYKWMYIDIRLALIYTHVFYMETIPLPGKCCKSQGLYYRVVAFEQGGIFIVPYLIWHRTLVFTVSHGETPCT